MPGLHIHTFWIDQARAELELAHEILLETLGADHVRTVRVAEVLDAL